MNPLGDFNANFNSIKKHEKISYGIVNFDAFNSDLFDEIMKNADRYSARVYG